MQRAGQTDRNLEASVPTPTPLPPPEPTDGAVPEGLSLPQLLLLDEAALVFIQDMEYLLYVFRALFLQANHLEELFVVEGVDSCWQMERRVLKMRTEKGLRKRWENGDVTAGPVLGDGGDTAPWQG